MPTQRTKRQTRSSTTEIDGAPTTDLYLERVITSTDCHNHDHVVEVDYPCYYVDGLTDRAIYAICDSRAQRAGFNGTITPMSLSASRRPFTR